MKLLIYLLIAFAFSSCTGRGDSQLTAVRIDEDRSVYLTADEVVESFSVFTLKGDEPLDDPLGVSVYGEELFVENLSSDRLYYFKNHQYVSTLYSVGRGPGEYLSINSYSYDPESGILYVVTDNVRGVLRYKVPSMEYIGTIPGSAQLSAVAVLPSGKLGIVDRSPDLRISYFTCLDLVDYSVDTLFVFDSIRFQDRGLYRSGGAILMGFDWVPSSIEAITERGHESLAQYSFGKMGIPLNVYEGAAMGDMMAGIKLVSAKHSEGKLFGSFQARKESDAVSFWYTKNDDEEGRLRFCRIMENGNVSVVRGMAVSGLNIRLNPFTVTEDGFAMLVNGPSDLLIEPDVPMGEMAKEIVKAVDSQKNDNPVVVYFSMKKL